MRSPRLVGLGLISAVALTACGGASASAPASTPPSTSTGSVQVGATFGTDPGDDAITYDPALVPVGSHATVSSETGDGGTTVMLAVRGLLPDRRYGAHAHVESCGETGDAAGPHFQNQVDPVQPSVDPAFANPQNEIWLDLTTDSAGAGSATANVEWGFEPDRRAKSVIIHEMGTATGPGEAGKAGARPACINVEF